jgi:hypothetical protein
MNGERISVLRYTYVLFVIAEDSEAHPCDHILCNSGVKCAKVEKGRSEIPINI